VIFRKFFVKVHIEHNAVEADQYLYLAGRTEELRANQIDMKPTGGNYLKQIFDTFNDLFVETLGTVPGHTANEDREDARRPRLDPFALLDRVDKEIDRLEADGIIERVEYASWGTPIVPIVKSDAKSIYAR
jgi:hypothetical protein